MIQVLKISSVKVMIDKSFLIVFMKGHIVYYDLIRQKTNNIWQHSYSPAVLSQVTLNQLTVGQLLLETFLLKSDREIYRLSITEQFMLVSEVESDLTYDMTCQKYHRHWWDIA